MSKPKKEKKSASEKFLGVIAGAQVAASKKFEGAHQAMLREANADQSGIIRSRAAGSVWQGLAGDMGANRMAGGDSRRQGQFENLAEQALGGALRGGSLSGMKMKDEVILAGAKSRLSNAQSSGPAARAEAEQLAAVASNKVKLANEWQNNVAGAAVTLGSMGASMGYDAWRTRTPSTQYAGLGAPGTGMTSGTRTTSYGQDLGRQVSGQAPYEMVS